MTRVVVVTGTNTDVGKTIVTAALAATASGRVLVVKPVQTGVAGGDPGDADVVSRLTGVDVETWTVLDEPLAPETAARRAGVTLPSVADHAAHVRAVAADHDVVVVEGAGGLLVRLDSDGGTLLDLAVDLATTHPVEVVVVCAASLGTLNIAELTVGALRSHGLEPTGLVIGSWPDEPGLAEHCNREDLPRVTGVPLVGVVPAGSGALAPAAFVAAAATWLT
ncbi:dethiobiotin synthase [Nocardioides plantarum]|uniref:ATP-dependent dethiobiotin synthetase BioD n=1 Tax=Nocardioides plantarum TaxID=29299 RepID=A0ABV5KBR3_9ACTN|nr:dethiobiotin synthase [Nocardioides plantarum]